MKNIVRLISLICLITILTIEVVDAEVYCLDPVKRTKVAQKAAECVPAVGSSQLNVNNVRAYIETSGSMWFRNSTAQYFIPKEGQASSMFAASLWIGGMDVAGQLKLAAVRFRQVGNDFWPGPLTLSGATIEQAMCALYDRHFVMTKNMARDHMLNYDQPGYVMPDAIKNWPGNPIDLDTRVSWYIAPYVDVDGDGSYNPEMGDYPYYDFDNELCPWTAENRAKAARGELPQTMETKAGISSGGIMADQVLKGDQTLWWIFNDKGAAHTETKGFPIGLEIRAQAFAFATTDDLNNMTFYSYEIINRSSFELTNTFFSQWVDPDLGYSHDDYVGCDVERGLGYCYNGKTPDGQGLITHYGENPPAVGVDFFQGPYLDPDGEDNPSYRGDNIFGPSFAANYANACEIVTAHGNSRYFEWDSTGNNDTVKGYVTVRAEAINGVNFGDGIVDNERYGMRRFVYHNNDNDVVRGDPVIAIDYYNFLQGIWKNNTRMTFGGTGYNPGSTMYCDFMFPGTTDPCNWGTNGKVVPGAYLTERGWREEVENNQYGDRRFMQSAGPFTLKKGAINYITVGIPWARATGAPYRSVELLKIVDDKAQNLFESCFKVVDGPDAPDLVFREMDGMAICFITNTPSSTNYKGGYIEKDNSIPAFFAQTRIETMDTIFYYHACDTLTDINGMDSVDCYLDSTLQTWARTVNDTVWYDQYYRFEGYQIYQLSDPTVGPGELSDNTKAELIFQCDIRNGVKQIINHKYNAVVATEVPTEMVNGSDQGIVHSFEITEDKFGIGSGTGLTNYKKYYYMAIAYAYNSYAPYSTDPGIPDGLYGQKNPYLPGNKNIKTYTVIPHKTAIEENGTVVQSAFGTQPQIIQFEGHGNGGNPLLLTKQTTDEILRNGKADSLVFEKNAGPINVQVVDPLRVIGKEYTLRFYNKDSTLTTVNDSTCWRLEYEDDNGIMQYVLSDTSISVPSEQLLLDLGISIFIGDAKHKPLNEDLNSSNETSYYLFSSVDFINASITYQNPARPWFGGVPQQDGNTPLSWIRAGQTKDGDWALDNQDYEQKRKEDFYIPFVATSADAAIFKVPITKATPYTLWLDGSKQFARIINGGTFAPYPVTSYYDNNPAFGFEGREGVNFETVPKNSIGGAAAIYPVMTELYSVDIVLTADTNLWSRCPVVELADDPAWADGGAVRHNLRKAPSVYRNGMPMTSGAMSDGMGWFPGYAICVETGERLNVMFGENSMFGPYNGANMIFDPYPSLTWNSSYYGRHYLYVFGHRDLYGDQSTSNSGRRLRRITEHPSGDPSRGDICPAYDGGEWLYNKLKAIETTTPEATRIVDKNYIYKNVMWTSMVTANGQYQWLEKGNDVTIRIRVTRPYQRWTSTTGTGKQNPENDNMPLYKFSTKNIATLTNQKDVAIEYMDSIYITPNPYYGIATGGYEASQVDTRVKIINLPQSCQVKIYTLNGTLIRQFDFNSPERHNRDNNSRYPNSTSFLEWDLKNSANIPIASGMYMIHIQDNETNAVKTLKFLCIQRPIDVNAF